MLRHQICFYTWKRVICLTLESKQRFLHASLENFYLVVNVVTSHWIWCYKNIAHCEIMVRNVFLLSCPHSRHANNIMNMNVTKFTILCWLLTWDLTWLVQLTYRRFFFSEVCKTCCQFQSFTKLNLSVLLLDQHVAYLLNYKLSLFSKMSISI